MTKTSLKSCKTSVNLNKLTSLNVLLNQNKLLKENENTYGNLRL